MRLWISMLCGLTLFGCNEVVDDCPNVWVLNKSQIAATATSADGSLQLKVPNSEGPNAITLQKEIDGSDFDLNLELQLLESDSLSSPQFRFEVIDTESSSEKYSGIAIQHNVFYCYVGNSAPENIDNRLVDFNVAQLQISKSKDTIICSATVNGVFLEFRNRFEAEQVAVRLVLGTVGNGDGLALALIDDFRSASDATVISDDFSCRSW